ncbi:MAG: outer membrane protein assembly factor BamA [Bacteroidia bacterium]|nr:outer membrane protein assembly factor BamA [Bacteroidia bacterium]
MRKFLLCIFMLFSLAFCSVGQDQINPDLPDINYSTPHEYEIGGITVSGIKYLDENVLAQLSGLTVGDKIMVPGDKISKAIEKLWDQGLFSNVKISATKIIENKIFINISLLERPRLSKFSFTGVKKGDVDDIRGKIKLVTGNQVTDNIISNTINTIKTFYIGKGYLNCDVSIRQENDTTLSNHVILYIDVDKKERIKIREITFKGNDKVLPRSKFAAAILPQFLFPQKKVMPDRKLRHAMKETKQKRWWNIFKSSKYIEDDYKTDKLNIIKKYNSKGFRDARIVTDSLIKNQDNTISIHITLEEGEKYYFRNITWSGNTKYTSQQLSNILNIKKGDIYDQSVLEDKIYSETGVFSIYQDDGYLFSSINPVEILVQNDSIDLEMQVYEGKQARINNVIIKGNTKTNEHVIRREIRTKPGQLYNRSDIIRTHRELATLGYFDPEKIGVNPIPNPSDGTVDIEYTLEEKSSDQIEVSGGWGSNMIVGSVGLVFNNFSTRNFFKKSAWRPLPSGDGQRLSFKIESNGIYYSSYNLSFAEPWLGGKKPNSLSVSVYRTIQSNGIAKGHTGRESIYITGAALGLGKRLKVPDDFFLLENQISYERYTLNDWTNFLFANGYANNLSYLVRLSRNSIDQPIYPRTGSLFSLSLQITPPYSVINGKDYSTMTAQEKYRWIEYHKWTFNASWFTRLAGDLVLNTKAQFGFLGYFNKDARSPFEGYTVGGDGLSGYNLYGRETIGLRGYENGSLTPTDGANIYNKLTMEMRYPVSLNPAATIYALTFLEGGNAWYDSRTFNPFDIKRSAGFGVRIFLQMFGMLGVDWGYGFDAIPNNPSANKGQFHFVIGQQF